MNKEKMEQVIQTLIGKVFKLEAGHKDLAARVEKLEAVLGNAVKVSPEEAQKLLAATAASESNPAEGGGGVQSATEDSSRRSEAEAGSDGKGRPDVSAE